jgi:hypothetical protein
LCHRKSRLDQIHREQILISGNKSSTPITRRNKENRRSFAKFLGRKRRQRMRPPIYGALFFRTTAPARLQRRITSPPPPWVNRLASSFRIWPRRKRWARRCLLLNFCCALCLLLPPSDVASPTRWIHLVNPGIWADSLSLSLSRYLNAKYPTNISAIFLAAVLGNCNCFNRSNYYTWKGLILSLKVCACFVNCKGWFFKLF